MNKIDELVDFLSSEHICSIDDIEQKLSLGKRSCQNLIRSARIMGPGCGFSIENIKDQGYLLVVDNNEKFYNYQKSMYSLPTYPDNTTRLHIATLYLIQNSDPEFCTYEEISSYLGAPRSTIINDIKRMKCLLNSYSCSLKSKSHHGIKVEGKEHNKRKLMTHIYNLDSSLLQIFDEDLNLLKQWILMGFEQYNIYYDLSVIYHLKHIISTSIIRDNHDVIVPNQPSRSSVKKAMEFVFQNIRAHYNFRLSDNNFKYTCYVVDQLISSSEISSSCYSIEYSKIYNTLLRIDKLYATKFCDQTTLLKDLTYHMHALKNRKKSRYTLVYRELDSEEYMYIASLQVSRTFIRFYPDIDSSEITFNDIYYISLFFRASYESFKKALFLTPYHINLISQSLMSINRLNMSLITQIFPNSNIYLNKNSGIYDILLCCDKSYVPTDLQTPLILSFSKIIDEHDIRAIKRKILVNSLGIQKPKNIYKIYKPLSSLVSSDMIDQTPIVSLLIEDEIVDSDVSVKPLFKFDNILLYTDLISNSKQSFITFYSNGKNIGIYMFLRIEDFYLYYDFDLVYLFVKKYEQILLDNKNKYIAEIIKSYQA